MISGRTSQGSSSCTSHPDRLLHSTVSFPPCTARTGLSAGPVKALHGWTKVHQPAAARIPVVLTNQICRSFNPLYDPTSLHEALRRKIIFRSKEDCLNALSRQQGRRLCPHSQLYIHLCWLPCKSPTSSSITRECELFAVGLAQIEVANHQNADNSTQTGCAHLPRGRTRRLLPRVVDPSDYHLIHS